MPFHEADGENITAEPVIPQFQNHRSRHKNGWRMNIKWVVKSWKGHEWSSFSVSKFEVRWSENCRMQEIAVHKIILLHPLQLSLSLSLCTYRYLVVCLGSWSCLGRCPIRTNGICTRKVVKTEPVVDCNHQVIDLLMLV